MATDLAKSLGILMALDHAETPKPFYDAATAEYARITEPYAAAIAMIREAIEELFGPVASLESPDAVLLRGPEPYHDAEAIIAALQRVKAKLDTNGAANG